MEEIFIKKSTNFTKDKTLQKQDFAVKKSMNLH
ncbi:hypothetical protein AsAng_0027260 [Aureispira anguillae]|uniref:Uncharacterized protein n=1 Tax=Aureispira anguillae TaxID=2864201 RepID=A0A916DU67_9BACT|nr:hypothetical protein AsAng_0027260 [Aureispira anguillae]